MTQYSSTPAGWYPDPAGQPGQRYHDGGRWTEHFVPTPPPTPPPAAAPIAPVMAVAVSQGGGTNHGLHLVLTLLTCGLWLPIWLLVALVSGGSSSTVAAVGPNGIITQARNNRRGLTVLAVVGALVLLGTAAEHPWLWGVFAFVGVLGAIAVWVIKNAAQREEELRREQFQRDMLINRAETEDKLYREGDDRGTYGQYTPPDL